MGRPERPVDPEAGPIQRLAWELRRLHEQAGSPSYRQLARRAHYSATTLSEAAGGQRLPSLPVVQAYARACGGDVAKWQDRWRRAAASLQGSAPTRESFTTPDAEPAARRAPARQFGRLRVLGKAMAMPALTCLAVAVISTVRRRWRPGSPTLDAENAA